MEILKFNLQYLDDILKIEKECFPEKSRFGKDYLMFLWKNFPEGFLIAKENEKILGYGICQKEKEIGIIFSIAVKEEFQRRGIGSKILKRLIEVLRENNLKKVILHVRKQNKKAISFYQKFGFKIKKEIKRYYSDGETAYLMEKIIGE